MTARNLITLLAGAIFGLGLALSGMTDPSRVSGFLDVAGAWDPTLVFVMGGAVTAFGGGMYLWRRATGGGGWFGTRLPACDRDPVDRRLVIGAIIFGVGWGIGGFCPGPALANLAALHREALLFVPAMAIGMLLARIVAGVDRD